MSPCFIQQILAEWRCALSGAVRWVLGPPQMTGPVNAPKGLTVSGDTDIVLADFH